MSSSDRDPADAWRRAMARGLVFHEAVAERLGINATDLKCLELAGAEPAISPTRLADLTGLTTGAITGVLDRLERAGIVRREPDLADRRRVLVLVDPDRAREIAALYAPLTSVAPGPDDAADASTRAAITRYLDRLGERLEDETVRLRVAARGGFSGDFYAAPLGGATSGRLVFASGAARLSMNAAALGQQARVVVEGSASRLVLGGAAARDELLRATFEGPHPDIRVVDGVATIRYRRRLLEVKSRSASVALNPSISWTIDIEGGLTDLDADLRAVRLAGIDIRGGANHLRLRLPAPEGSVRVSFAGGTSDARIQRPAGIPVALRTRGGVSHLRFDDRRLGAVGGESQHRSDGFAGAADRYELELAGGASHIAVTQG